MMVPYMMLIEVAELGMGADQSAPLVFHFTKVYVWAKQIFLYKQCI